MKYTIAGLAILTSILGGCTPPKKLSFGGGNGKDDLNSTGQPMFGLCGTTTGTEYKGFGGVDLTRARVKAEEIPTLGDRYRIKPFSTFSQEYERATGIVPEGLASAATSFISPPDRWYREAEANGTSIFVSYGLGFEASLKMVEASNNLEYDMAPTQEAATKECTEFAEKAWRANPSAEEVSTCVNLMTTGTAAETENKVRWAHGFASILTSAGFLSY